MSNLVLSLFPGMDVLGMGFEAEGFCVVRGPDLLWGGDVRAFRPPIGVFQGVVGGPPCQCFSPIGNVNKARYGEDSVMPDLIPEFVRITKACAPDWFLMENSPRAYAPECPGYSVTRRDLDLAWLGESQTRRRAFWFGLDVALDGVFTIDTPTFVGINAGSERTVSSQGSVDWKGSRSREPRRTLAEMLELQGLPPDFLDEAPYTMSAKRKLVGNAVPLPMARAVAKAVKEALK